MRKVRVYIADADPDFVANVKRAVCASGQPVEVVGCAGSGDRAFNEISYLKPDVVLTETALPGLDGIALLRQLRCLRCPPAVIVCTRFYSIAAMELACKYGAQFFLCKPTQINGLIHLLLDCGQCTMPAAQAPETDVEVTSQRSLQKTREFLKDMGLSPRLNGSAYAIEAVALSRKDSLLMKNLSQGLYAALAERMNSTVSRVERALRSAITIAYERGKLSEAFPHRPSNREFIEYILRMTDEMEL